MSRFLTERELDLAVDVYTWIQIHTRQSRKDKADNKRSAYHAGIGRIRAYESVLWRIMSPLTEPCEEAEWDTCQRLLKGTCEEIRSLYKEQTRQSIVQDFCLTCLEIPVKKDN